MKTQSILQSVLLSFLTTIPGSHAFGQAVSPPATGLSQPAGGAVRLPVRFTSPDKGFASLALYNKEGVLVRSLMYAQPVIAGEQVIPWDGTTDMGLPAAAGEYTAKGVFFTESPSLSYVMTVGKSGNPPYRTPDGKGDWGGNLGGPSGICANSKSIMMVWGCVEDNQVTGIQQMDPDGNISMRYFSFYPWDTRMAAAMDETNFYLGILNGDKKRIEIAAYVLGQPRGKILTVLPTIAHKDVTESRWNGRFSAWLDGMAVSADTIYATIGSDNALFVIDRASGDIRKQVSLPSPRGVAVFNGRVYVTSGGKVLRLAPDGTVEATVVEKGVMAEPRALAIDRTGNLYVGDGGVGGAHEIKSDAGSRQVWVFSQAGKLLRKIGKEGGIPRNGRFDADGLGDILYICVGPNDRLWVQDYATSFPRTSRWSPQGKREQQWFGRKLTLSNDQVNPARPNEQLLFSDAFSDEPGISAYDVNIKDKTWTPSWHYDNTWADMYQEDVLLSNTHNNPLEPKRHPVFVYASEHPVTYKGRNYFMPESGNGDGAIFIYSADHKPRPVALVGYHRTEKKGDKIESFYDNGPNNWFTWADRSDDARMAMNEIIYTPAPPMLEKTMRLWSAYLDDQMNVHMKRPVSDGKDRYHLVDSVLPLKELLPNGAPVYDWSMLRDTAVLQPPNLNGGDGTKKVTNYDIPLPVETKDAYYAIVTPASDQQLKLPGIDGEGWWASRNWRKRLARFDKTTGKCLWAVGRRAPGRAEPGQMYFPAKLAGEACGALFVCDTLSLAWAWSTDGLFLGRVFNDTGTGIADAYSHYGELQSMAVWTDPGDGKIYLAAGAQGSMIYEVKLPKLQSLTVAAINISAQQTAQAKPWDPDGTPPTSHPTYVASFTAVAPNVDGDLFGPDRDLWFRVDGKLRPEMLVLLDGKRLANVRVMYDAKNMYLSYQVSGANGPINSGSELPFSPFVSGAYVDFSIAADWATPYRDVSEGDIRVVIAQVKEGAGVKDFEQGFWQKKRGGANPQTIKSPAAQVKMDHIGSVPGLKMAYKVGKKDAASGLINYTVEVSVPLASVGLTNPAGKTIGFDASVGVANASGDRRERAAHWAGLSESVVVDRPGSTQLLPGTWGSLTFAPATAR